MSENKNIDFLFIELFVLIKNRGVEITPQAIIAIEKLLYNIDINKKEVFVSIITTVLAKDKYQQNRIKQITEEFYDNRISPKKKNEEKPIDIPWKTKNLTALKKYRYITLLPLIAFVIYYLFRPTKPCIVNIIHNGIVINDSANFFLDKTNCLKSNFFGKVDFKVSEFEWVLDNKKISEEEDLKIVITDLEMHQLILKSLINGKSIATDTLNFRAKCEKSPILSIDKPNSNSFLPSKVLEFSANITNPSPQDSLYTYEWQLINELKETQQIIGTKKVLSTKIDSIGLYRLELQINLKKLHCSVSENLFNSINFEIEKEGNKLITTESVLVGSNNNWALLSPIIIVSIPYLLLFFLKNKQKADNKGKHIIDDEDFDSEPFEILFGDNNYLIEESKEINAIANYFTKRETGENKKMIPIKSIRETIKNHGSLHLVYKFKEQDKDFLFFIDNKHHDSHQIELFEFLIGKLVSKRVSVQKFYYSHNLNKLYDKNNKPHTLKSLAKKYIDYNLILFGNADQLIEKLVFAFKEDVLKTMLTWQNRAIVTPITLEDWSLRELLFKQQKFITVPAEIEAIELMAKTITEKVEVEKQKLLKIIDYKYSVSKSNFTTVEELKAYIKNDSLFVLLCSLAIYSRLNWQLTVSLTYALANAFNKKETDFNLDLNYNTLLKLSRIPWLHDDFLRDELRLELLKELDPKYERIAREQIIQLLNRVKNTLTENSFANYEYNTEEKVNTFLLSANKTKKYPYYKAEHKLIEAEWEEIADWTTKKYIEIGENTLMPLKKGTKKNHQNVIEYFSTVKTKRKSKKLIKKLLLTVFSALLMFIAYHYFYNKGYTFVISVKDCKIGDLGDFEDFENYYDENNNTIYIKKPLGKITLKEKPQRNINIVSEIYDFNIDYDFKGKDVRVLKIYTNNCGELNCEGDWTLIAENSNVETQFRKKHKVALMGLYNLNLFNSINDIKPYFVTPREEKLIDFSTYSICNNNQKIGKISYIKNEVYDFTFLEKENIIYLKQGNVYSTDGILLENLATRFNIHVNFSTVSDINFEKNVSDLAEAMSKMFSNPAPDYEKQFREARKINDNDFIIAKSLNYEEFKKVKNFPIINLGTNIKVRRGRRMLDIADELESYDKLVKVWHDDIKYSENKDISKLFGQWRSYTNFEITENYFIEDDIKYTIEKVLFTTNTFAKNIEIYKLIINRKNKFSPIYLVYNTKTKKLFRGGRTDVLYDKQSSAIKNIEVATLVAYSRSVTKFDNLEKALAYPYPLDIISLNLENQNTANINNISIFKNLLYLYLEGNPIDDIKGIKKLKKLKSLNIKNTNISQTQFEELKQALPNTRISYLVLPIKNKISGIISIDNVPTSNILIRIDGKEVKTDNDGKFNVENMNTNKAIEIQLLAENPHINKIISITKDELQKPIEINLNSYCVECIQLDKNNTIVNRKNKCSVDKKYITDYIKGYTKAGNEQNRRTLCFKDKQEYCVQCQEKQQTTNRLSRTVTKCNTNSPKLINFIRDFNNNMQIKQATLYANCFIVDNSSNSTSKIEFNSLDEALAHNNPLEVFTLNLINKNYTKISPKISQFKNLESLNLNNNKITKIEGLKNLTNLKNLYLSKNKISNVEGLEKLVNLITLDLSHNQISKIENLDKLTILKVFDLSYNQISKIEGLEKLSEITNFDLLRNKISKIEGLDKLNRLNKIDLSYNEISKIEGLEKLSVLTELFLHGNQITKIEGLQNLSKLKKLELPYNKITESEIKRFKNETKIQFIRMRPQQDLK